MIRTTISLVALYAAITLHGVQAQPTGNPKGSVAPSTQGNPAKTPANPARNVDTGRSDPLNESKGPPDVRTRRSERPGGGSATGGLTRRNPQDASPLPTPEPSSGNTRQPHK